MFRFQVFSLFSSIENYSILDIFVFLSFSMTASVETNLNFAYARGTAV